MEELKILVGMVADLPEMAIWVLVGFLCYKTFIIGGTLTIVRFLIDKVHNWSVTPRTKYINEVATTEVEGVVFSGDRDRFMQVLRGFPRRTGLNFMHGSDIDFLEAAVNEKLQRDGEK